MSLEEILQKYFNCKKPFNKNGNLSINGEIAYSKLVDLLYALDELVEINASWVIDDLDKLATSNDNNVSKMLDEYGNIIVLQNREV